MLRKVSSLTALSSFILLLLTSIILYIVPAGRVAYWANWKLWGLTKTEWTNLHVNLGVLFVVAILFHTWFNWNSILAYLKNRSKDLRIFTPPFNITLALVMAFTFGTYAGIPPFSTINTISEAIKENAGRYYGEPPYGHAELSSLKSFAQKTGMDLEKAMEHLRAAKIAFTGENQSLLDIAESSGLSPKELFLVMRPESESPKGVLPKEPPAGMGKKPLADLCREFSLDSEKVIRLLDREKINATAEMSIRQIAEGAGKDPFEVYDIIRYGLMKSEKTSN